MPDVKHCHLSNFPLKHTQTVKQNVFNQTKRDKDPSAHFPFSANSLNLLSLSLSLSLSRSLSFSRSLTPQSLSLSLSFPLCSGNSLAESPLTSQS